MSNQRRILLLGCGYTLRKVVEDLLGAGEAPDNITAVVSSEAGAIRAREVGIQDVRIIDIFDPNDKEILNRIPQPDLLVDSVPPARDGEMSPAQGVVNVIAAPWFKNLKRIVYLSTSGVFGGENGDWVDEKTDASPKNPRSAARLLCENSYQLAKGPVTSLRIAGIYGPGRGIGISLSQGRYSPFGKEDRWTNRIHVDDLATLIVKLINLPFDTKAPDILCACDDLPVKVGELVDFYCSKFSLPRNFSIREQSERDNLNQRVSNRMMKELIGRELNYPTFRDGAGTEFLAE